MIYRIVPKSEDELYHYGVLGMRWGVRRYQNYDGSRIKGGPVVNSVHAGHPRDLRNTVVGGQGGKAKGNARLAATASPKTGAEDAAQPKKNGMFEPTVKKGKGKEDSTPAAEIAKSVENSSRSTKDLLNIAQKHDPKIKKAQDEFESEAKKMSDKELRDRINRIKMEREYVSIKSEEVSTGYQKAKDVLDVVGDIAQIAFAVAGTIAMLKKAGIIHSDEEVDMVYDSLMSTELDDDFISHAINMDDEYCLDYLEHHGILGMKWGVRRYQNYDGTRIGTGGRPIVDKAKQAESGVRNTVVGGQGGKAKGNARLAATASVGGAKTKVDNTIVGGQGGKAVGNARLAAKAPTFGSQKPKIRADGVDESKFTSQQKQISRDAAKDAKEFMYAKAFYGEGAGNRRKAIKTTVEAKKKKNEFYAKEFEYHCSQVDMEEAARQARNERSRRDTATNTRRALNKTNRALGQLSRYL